MDLDIISRVLFPRPPPSYNVDSFPGELLWVPRSLNPQTASPEDCVPLCLLQCRRARYMVVYVHSNFEDIGRCYSFCGAMRDHLQVHVLIVEYPGYGICPGTSCDERGAIECTTVALRFANEVLRWPRDSIILFGRSIGTGPATALAAKNKYGGLILACPFLSVRDLVRDYIGMAAELVRERFPNREHMPHVRCPCLLVHGQKDSMVPVRHGQQLYEACLSRKCFVSPALMDHNTDLLHSPRYFLGPVQDFFQLPEYRNSEIQVPSWAFDKQLSPLCAPSLRRAPPSSPSFRLSSLGALCRPSDIPSYAQLRSSCAQCGQECRGFTTDSQGIWEGMKSCSVIPVQRWNGQSKAVTHGLEVLDLTPRKKEEGTGKGVVIASLPAVSPEGSVAKGMETESTFEHWASETPTSPPPISRTV